MAGLAAAAAGSPPPSLTASEEHCKFCFDVLVAKLQGRALPEATFANRSLKAPLFVTWTTTREDALRGCIGNFSDLELGSGIRDYALVAALEDSRFQPVSLSEVPGLSVGVSLLVNFENGRDARDWEIGKHGIRISFSNPSNGRTCGATFLPEVAKEQGWTVDETLTALVRKAGYRGSLSESLIASIKLVRYQSSKARLSYEAYQQAKTA
ncbi:AMME syndrome candidate 1 protein-like [Hondaea fermentalgiana]|uniref:AMME syndrome candidate 1 protein-like n=1 Tax=Hondaea fermentalgiana TaxID=2315210 RepID=A0A2R5GTC3_9STRA|nr:AMME syndrome candidate 1 protein-like [Hondaea fermentalgiana]|eukprot:GBG31134.1 AMME syndrome candidate 1 protein-like [Hondaea fermentalgiana]